MTAPHLPALELRPHQVEAVRAALDHFASGAREGLIQAPCGAGKTIIALALARIMGRTVFVAHRGELLDQPRATLRDAWPACRAGIVAAERDEAGAADLVLASVQTLARRAPDESFKRLERILAAGPPRLVILDEAHHYDGRGGWDGAIAEALERSGAKLLGLTATPIRGDGRDLSRFGRVIWSMQLAEAMQRGLLAPLERVVRVRVPELEHTPEELELGEYAAERALRDRVAEQLDAIVPATAAAWRDHARRPDGTPRRGVVYCVLVEQAKRTAEALRRLGVRAETLSGDTPRPERERVLIALKRGALDVVCNASLLTEGWDCPPADCVLLARPCVSPTLFIQCVGRASRLAPGKDDWRVVDLGGGSELHRLAIAPVLDGEAREGAEREAGAGPGAEDRNMMRPRRAPPPVRWVDVLGDRRIWAADCEDRVTVAVRLAGERWLVERLRGKGPPELVASYENEALALDVGADVVDRHGGRWSQRRTAFWRGRPATDAQRRALVRWRSSEELDPRATQGEASDALTRVVARSKVKLRRKPVRAGA